MPRVSIILATYNRAENFLPKAIDSVIKQTYKDYELMIIDDGSTDKTREVVEEYIRKYPNNIRYLVQEHKGQAAANNYAIKESCGEFIAFIDSDDLWMPTKLEKQVRFLDGTKAHMVHVGRRVVYLTENKARWLMPMPVELASDSKGFLAGKTFISNTMLVRKRSKLDIGEYDETLMTTEDTDFWLKFAQKYEIRLIEKPLVIIHKHDDNMATKNMEQKYTDRIHIYKKLLKSNHPAIDKANWRRRLIIMTYGLACEKLEKGKIQESLEILRKVVRAKPFIGKEIIRKEDRSWAMIKKLLAPYKMLIRIYFVLLTKRDNEVNVVFEKSR